MFVAVNVNVNVNVNIVTPSDLAGGYRPFGFSTFFFVTVVTIARNINRGPMALISAFPPKFSNMILY